MLSEEKLRGVAAVWSSADVPLLLVTIRELQARVAELETSLYASSALAQISIRGLTDDKRALLTRVAELETKCERCGLKLAHSGTMEDAAEMYASARVTANADDSVHWVAYTAKGELIS